MSTNHTQGLVVQNCLVEGQTRVLRVVFHVEDDELGSTVSRSSCQIGTLCIPGLGSLPIKSEIVDIHVCCLHKRYIYRKTAGLLLSCTRRLAAKLAPCRENRVLHYFDFFVA